MVTSAVNSATPGPSQPLSEDLVAKLRSAVRASRVNLTESAVRDMFAKRIEPNLQVLTSRAKDIGDILVNQIQGDLLAQRQSELAKTRESLSNNGVLDSLINNIVGFLTAASDTIKGVGEQVSELYAKDKAGVLEFATHLFDTVKHIMKNDPFMKMVLTMPGFQSIQSLLPAVDQKAINAAPNAANN